MRANWTSKDFPSAMDWRKKPKPSHSYQNKARSVGYVSTLEIERQFMGLHFPSSEERTLADREERYEDTFPTRLDEPFDVHLLKILNNVFMSNLYPMRHKIVVIDFMARIEEEYDAREVYGSAVDMLLDGLNELDPQRQLSWKDVIDIINRLFQLELTTETLASVEREGEEEEELPVMMDLEKYRQMVQDRCPDYNLPAISGSLMEPIGLHAGDKEDEEKRLHSKLESLKEERKKLYPDTEDVIREFEELKGLADYDEIVRKRMGKSPKVVIE